MGCTQSKVAPSFVEDGVMVTMDTVKGRRKTWTFVKKLFSGNKVGDCPEVELICDTRPTSEPSGEPTPMPTPEPSPEPIRKPILPLDEIQLRVLNSRAVTPTRAKKRLRRKFGAELDVKSLPNISLQIRAENDRRREDFLKRRQKQLEADDLRFELSGAEALEKIAERMSLANRRKQKQKKKKKKHSHKKKRVLSGKVAEGAKNDRFFTESRQVKSDEEATLGELKDEAGREAEGGINKGAFDV